MVKNNFYPAVFAFLLLLVAQSAFSQDYKTGIGLRGGWISGLTVKHFIKEGRALEGILSPGYGWGRYGGFQVTGLYEIHKPAFAKDDVEGLFWFYGGGAHFGGGYHRDHWHYNNGAWGGYYHEHNYVAFGIDFIFGIEYKIEEVPITLGLDVKPFFELVTDRDAHHGFWDSAFSIRYVF